MTNRLFCLIAALLGTGVAAQTFPVFGTNAVWAFAKGTSEASLPDPTTWRTRTFSDAAWVRGAAPFFYGEPLTGGTQLSDMQNAYTTLFLRRAFVITNATDIASLEVNAAVDDGFIMWVNGVEVARFRAPVGEPVATSVAGENAVPDPVGYGAFALPPPASYLVSGTNVLAVQVFNVSLSSSDLVFDASLAATVLPRVAPVVVSASPVAGPVTQLGQITVTFSEPVTGVDAGDLMLNEVSCTAVTGSGGTYTFTCPVMPLGSIGVSWNPTSGIQDLSVPPVPFDPLGQGARWLYELYDPSAPRVVSTYPRAGSTVRQLGRVEVIFDRAMSGVDYADLLLNGEPATNVYGAGAGPYQFEFPVAPSGPVSLQWASGHGITDVATTPLAFGGGGWSCIVDPNLPLPDVVINEILAENVAGIQDEEGDREDWIELFNRSTNAVNLAGWSLTDDVQWPRQWVFPARTIPARGYLVVFASGKDRRTGANLHTNFKLALDGEYVGLFSPDSLREAASELAPGFPEQRPDYAYGRTLLGDFRYLQPATPGASNVAGTVSQAVREVRFSEPRGFYLKPFNLTLSCETAGATIRYTTNGSVPTLTNGMAYTQPIPVNAMRLIRAAAFRPDMLPSKVSTHTYLYNLAASRRVLPALSLVTATNNLYGSKGIMETNPRNTTQHGLAWERPVSVELIRPGDNGGFQADCGLRVQGGDYVRGIYNYRSTALPESKYSFRLYFRGDYGTSRLEHPWFPETTQTSFDTVVLRAGMNDHSNPFLIDEFVRTLVRDCGQPTPVGTFVHFFLNGVYKGLYNPCERIDIDFLRAYHGGDERWDLIAQFNELAEGDMASWTALKNLVSARNLTITTNYLEVARRLDLTNFVDYLAPLIYVDNDDWPHNNWRAARNRTSNGPFRFYAWDAEWACGVVNGHAVSWNTLLNQLSSTAPPWGTAEIAQIFNKLKVTTEFKLLMADRMHRHYFNGGALTDARIRARYDETRARLNNAVLGFNNVIGTSWIPNRRRYVLDHLQRAGFLSSSNAPAFRQFGGRVAPGFRLTMTNLTGTMLYTLDGTDPRVAFTGAIASTAQLYNSNQPPVLSTSTLVRARTYWMSNLTVVTTNWSAVTEASFQVDVAGLPLRFGEINYNPPGGDAYEFIEIVNLSPLPVDVGGVSLEGAEFRFPNETVLAGGARVVLASDANRALFAQRYPGVVVAGWFGGSLSNGGERLALLDRDGVVVTSVDYRDDSGWPAAADGLGASLEVVDPEGDPDDPANWVASVASGGSPGGVGLVPPVASVRLSEIAAAVSMTEHSGGLTNDWIELENVTTTPINLTGWSVATALGTRRYEFPALVLPAGGFVVLQARTNAVAGTLHTGFPLERQGDSLFLFDGAGRRIDAMGYGLQIPGFTVARLGLNGDWGLAEPTPGGPNEAADVGEASSVVVNEFLPNPPAGTDDWIELHNRDQARPVALQGLGLGATNAFQRIGALSFVAPGGFAVIRADGNSGPDHVEFKLPASGGFVAVSDVSGIELQRLTYAATAEGVSIGLLPDGNGVRTTFVGSASPGASNYTRVAASVRLNEVLASSRTNVVDFVELHNATTALADLAGMSLSIDDPDSGQWVFPAGVTIPAGGFLAIQGDAGRPASLALEPVLNCGRTLAASGGTVRLFNKGGQLVDQVDFGFQLPDRPVGPVGTIWTLLSEATPGAPNADAAFLGNPVSVCLNEWKTGGAGDDWIEVHNRDPLPVDLGGCVLTDDPSLAGQTNHLIRPLTFVQAGGCVKWLADGDPEQGPEHLAFRLDAQGETLRLYRGDFFVLDTIDYAGLTPGVSQGRFPDGATNLVFFPESASPGAPNWLKHPKVAINEVLAHTDPPLEDAIELVNLKDEPVDISGWWLGNDRLNPRQFRIPAGTVLTPRGHRVFYQGQFDATPGVPGSFRLDPDRDGQVVLAEVGVSDALTGFRSVVELGASENGVSFGRVLTSVGEDFGFLVRRTFGQDAPESLEQFRSGAGAPNAEPRIGPVVISEILYHPARGTNQVPEEDLEFVELQNITDQPQPLWEVNGLTNFWRLRGGIDFDFEVQEPVLPAHGRLVVVGFDPRTNTAALSAFLDHYRLMPAAAAWMRGPFRGRLGNAGDELILQRPGEPVVEGTSLFIPRLRVDRVVYQPTVPWSAAADGAGMSLQRVPVSAYGNDPANWLAAWPTPGAPNAQTASDGDGDGLPDEWELAHGLSAFAASGLDGAGGDPDEDGLTNLDEFRMGSDPHELTIRILSFRMEDRTARIRFNAARNARYRVEIATSISAPVWQTLSSFGPAAVSGPVEQTNAVPVLKALFFRVILTP